MTAEEFLRRHFADLRDGELIEIRAVYKDDSKPVARKYFTDPAEAADYALRGNKAGYHAFYGVNPRSKEEVDAGEKGADALARATHVWVDIDNSNIDVQRIIDDLPLPETVIHSGGGYQFLWRIDGDDPSWADAEYINCTLAAHLDGDSHATDLPRVLRLPDTINHKPRYPAGTKAFVAEAHTARHDFGAFLRAMPATKPNFEPTRTPDQPPLPSSSSDIDATEFYDALAAIDPWSISYDEWLRVLMAIHAYDPSLDGLAHAEDWGQGKSAEIRIKWKSFKRGGSNPATVFHFARQAGWTPARPSAPVPDFGETPEAAPKTKRQPPRINVTSFSDFIAEVDTPPEWVVENFLHASGVSLLVAKQKVGKSSFAANLAISVGSGLNFLDRPTNGGLVHVYSLEVTRDWVRQQYRDLARALDCQRPLLALHASTGLIDHAFDQIAEAVMRDKPKLVIIDTLAKAVPITDGNNYHEVYKAMQPVMQLAEEAGCHIMCVHHTNKGVAEGADAVMGSVAFAASVDLTIMLRRDREADMRTMELEARFLPEQPPLAFDFDEQRRLVVLGDHQRVLRETAEKRVLAYVAAEPGSTASDIQQATGLPREIAGPVLYQLTQVMRVRAEGSPKRYSIVEYHAPSREMLVGQEMLRFTGE